MKQYRVIIPLAPMDDAPQRLTEIAAFLKASGHHTAPIVVHDAPTRHACYHAPEVQWVLRRDPFNYADAINAGIWAAGTDDVVILGDDACPASSDCFSLLRALTIEDETIGLAAPGLLGVGPASMGNRGTQKERIIDTPLAFHCVYLPRRTIDLVGLLDERYTGYGLEDVDYQMRIWQAGLDIAVHDGAVVHHGLRYASAYRTKSAWEPLFEQNKRIFADKWSISPESILTKENVRSMESQQVGALKC